MPETNFSAESLGKEQLESKITGLKEKEKIQDKDVESALTLVTNALENAKSYVNSQGSCFTNANQLLEFVQPWDAWDGGKNGKDVKPYMKGFLHGKKVNFQDKIYSAGLLGNSSLAKTMRQIWRQEMFEWIMKNDSLTLPEGGIAALLSTQKVPPQRKFADYLKPATALGITLTPEEIKLMEKNTKETDITNTTAGVRINVGFGMITIPPDKCSGLIIHHTIEKDGKTYGLMKNGCEGNIVEMHTVVPSPENRPATIENTNGKPIHTPYTYLLTYGNNEYAINDASLREKLDTGLFTFQATTDPNTLKLKYGNKEKPVSLIDDAQKSIITSIKELLGDENWRQVKIIHELNNAQSLLQAQSIVNSANNNQLVGLYPADLDSINNGLKKYQITNEDTGKFTVIEKRGGRQGSSPVLGEKETGDTEYDTLIKKGTEAEGKGKLEEALNAYQQAFGTNEGEENHDYMNKKIQEIEARIAAEDAKNAIDGI